MERKEAMLKTGYSKLFLAVMAVFLCATPTFGYLIATGEEDIYADNPDIYDGLLAMPGSIVNIYSGAIGDGATTGITVSTGEPHAVVTVYGTNFAINGVPFETPASEPIPYGVLTGFYEDGSEINLLFISSIPINLKAPTPEPEDPADLILQLIITVADLNLQNGIENSLDAKLGAALNALDDVNANNDVAAINTLQAFINAVEAQRDNKITPEQADILVTYSQAIIALLST